MTSQLQRLIKTIRSVLTTYPEIHYAAVFGSAVNDRLTKTSDIDIAIAGNNPLKPDELIDLAAALNERLPFPVDLIDLNTVTGPILQQALCTGVIMQKKSPEKLANLIIKMWYNQADMMPYTMRILEKRCQRFING